MILQCPSCNARFLVADALIPPLGRTVKCGACSFQWFVEPARLESIETAPVEMPAMSVDFATLAEREANAPDESIEIIEPRKLPVVSSHFFAPKPYRIAAMVLAASWLIVAALAYYPRAHDWPFIGIVYRMVGLTNTQGLTFSNVAMQRSQEDDKTLFDITGAIANGGKVPCDVPAVRVQLKDKAGKVLWTRSYPVHHVVMAGESYPFHITDVKTSFAESTASIVLDLGNKLELAVR